MQQNSCRSFTSLTKYRPPPPGVRGLAEHDTPPNKHAALFKGPGPFSGSMFVWQSVRCGSSLSLLCKCMRVHVICQEVFRLLSPAASTGRSHNSTTRTYPESQWLAIVGPTLNQFCLESQVAQNDRPLHLEVAHIWDKVAPMYGLPAF